LAGGVGIKFSDPAASFLIGVTDCRYLTNGDAIMIEITKSIFLNPAELKFSFMASPGPGGQNVNKVATAVLLRFNVVASTSFSEELKARLIAVFAKRITSQGDLIIKATRFRTQERNKHDAINRLCELLKSVAIPPAKRYKTRPTLASKNRRLSTKKIQGVKKALRRSGYD
jgi:ribosome-associated protein